MTLLVIHLAAADRVAAHGLDARRVQVELDGTTARVAATPGVDAFPTADTNGDARLDRAEVAAARESIRARFAEAFQLRDGVGERPTCDAASVSTVGNGDDHVRISLVCNFAREPDPLTVEVGALGFAPFTVEGVRTRRVGPGIWTPQGGVVRGTVPVGGGRVDLFADAGHAAAPPTAEFPPAAPWRTGAGIAALASCLLLVRALRTRAGRAPPRPAAFKESQRDPQPPV